MKFALAGHRFERLEVDASVALRIFEDNRYKALQIPQIAAQGSSGMIYIVFHIIPDASLFQEALNL